MEIHSLQLELSNLLNTVVRLAFACLLGGIIGFERGVTHHKPAGLRTHILVSLGSALVMLTSEYAMLAYPSNNIDPTRIGAQVVSGIGFLGAGAILRSGMSVKGLTTAASLWAVACVGLACGIGFISGAVLATLIIWLVLSSVKNIELRVETKNRYHELSIEAATKAIIIGDIGRILSEKGCTVHSMMVSLDELGLEQLVKCSVVLPEPDSHNSEQNLPSIIAEIQRINGVKRVYD
jgi:putative Mg2+ transporter-C (MgtC) family protein